MDYIIGVDIGTTSMKAVACCVDGHIPDSVSRSYHALSDDSGRHELEPLMLWDTFVTLVGELLSVMEGRGNVVGVALSCAMHSLIAVDEHGGLLTNAITWADLRSERYATALKASEAGREIYKRTGTPLHPMSPLSKLLWLQHDQPAVFAGAARFVSIKEFIWFRLFGKWQVDHSIASATGLFDIYTLTWCDVALRAAGIDGGRLSEPVACTHVEVLRQAGRKGLGSSLGLGSGFGWGLGLPEGTPFVIGGSDGCLANLGSGALEPGETALTIGTSGAIRMTTEAPVYDEKERIFHYVLGEGFYVSGGATNNGAVVLQWWLDSVQGDGGAVARAGTAVAGTADAGIADPGIADADAGTVAALVELAAGVPAGSGGIIFLPYLQGERAPVWDAEARGMFFGLKSSHGQGHFVRAILEGICASLYQIGNVLEGTIGPVRHIIASGGFTRSRLWLQMMADYFNKTVYTTDGADASAKGAAIMGWYALGGIDSLRAKGIVGVKETYEPNAERHVIYQKVFNVYGQLYERTKDLMHGG